MLYFVIFAFFSYAPFSSTSNVPTWSQPRVAGDHRHLFKFTIQLLLDSLPYVSA